LRTIAKQFGPTKTSATPQPFFSENDPRKGAFTRLLASQHVPIGKFPFDRVKRVEVNSLPNGRVMRSVPSDPFTIEVVKGADLGGEFESTIMHELAHTFQFSEGFGGDKSTYLPQLMQDYFEHPEGGGDKTNEEGFANSIQRACTRSSCN
jgi:hypothetical protein